MTDNLEELQRDWPGSRPKDFSPRGTVNILLAMTILISVIVEFQALLVILHLKSNHVHWWYLKAVSLELAVLLPGAGAIGFYQRMRAAVLAGGGSQELLLYLQYQGVLLLMMIYAGIALITGVLLTVLSLMQITPS